MEPDETQCIPVPISNLLKYRVGESINIEEGLRTPDDENVFLLSSIAFLQKQLMKRLGDQTLNSEPSDDVKRKYSDLLLVESGQKSKRQKCFIRLPNMEKFDKVLRSEASLPDNILSNTQILPLPRKSKNTRLHITNIFKQKSNMNIENSVPKKSNSLFNMFRRSLSSIKSSESNLSCEEDSTVQINPQNYIVIEEDEYIHQSMCSLPSISNLKQNIQQAASKEGTNLYDDDLTRYQPNPFRQKELSDIEEEILKVIPTETNLEIKKSINEKLRVSRKVSQASIPASVAATRSLSDVTFVRKEDDFLEDPQTGIKFKCIPQSTGKRIREQQSKLSVCIEDEPESDIDIFSQRRNYPFNAIGNIHKSIVSPETIEVLMSELLFQLEEHTQKS